MGMKKYIFTLIFLIISIFSYSQNDEKWIIQTHYKTEGQVGFSVQKDFYYKNFTFGPRIEFSDKLLDTSSYINIHILSLFYRVNDFIEVGISPFWMNGPLPRRGIYYTPSSIITRLKKDDLALELWINTKSQSPIILRFSHNLNF
jgi:hypothetical protein